MSLQRKYSCIHIPCIYKLSSKLFPDQSWLQIQQDCKGLRFGFVQLARPVEELLKLFVVLITVLICDVPQIYLILIILFTHLKHGCIGSLRLCILMHTYFAKLACQYVSTYIRSKNITPYWQLSNKS